MSKLISHNTIELKKVESLYSYAGMNAYQVRCQLKRTKEVVYELTYHKLRAAIVEYFMANVASFVTDKAVSSSWRKKEVAACRFACFYFLRKHTRMTFSAIGEKFGGRDHSTVVSGISTYEDLLETDKYHQKMHNELLQIINN
jgi:chromosomal replication initiator protein